MEKHSINRYAIAILFLLLPSLLFAAPPSRSYTYISGSTISPSDVTTNEDNIYNYLTRGVDTYADSSITTDDVLDGTLTNTDISGTAVISVTKIADGSVSNTEFQYLDGVTSAIQTQINTKGDILYADTRFKVGSFTRDTILASGTQAVTGVGFTPKAVLFFALQNQSREISWGFDDGTIAQSTYDDQASAGTYQTSSISISDEETSGTTAYEGIVSSFGSDGFTITWTKTGSPTGTLTIAFLAFR